MLQNAYSFAKIGADTGENEQILPKFAKNWQLPQLRGRLVPGPLPPDGSNRGAQAHWLTPLPVRASIGGAASFQPKGLQ